MDTCLASRKQNPQMMDVANAYVEAKRKATEALANARDLAAAPGFRGRVVERQQTE